MTPVILTRSRSPGGRLRRCVLPALIARRCRRRCPALSGSRDACLRPVARNRDACLRLVARNRDACLRLVARNRDAPGA